MLALLVLVGVIAFGVFDRSRRVLGGAVAGAVGAALVAALLAVGGYSALLGRPYLAVAAAAVALAAARSWWTQHRRQQQGSDVVGDR